MGLARGGANLGGAQGSITIDVTQLAVAQQAVLNASRQMTQALNTVSPSVQTAQQNITSLTGGLRQLAGAFGVSLGAAGAVQLGRALVATTELTTAYNRQRVAAINLAGSQEKLNALLSTYERVSGGAVSDVDALASVTNLLSVGFADSTEELERFARAIRGISIARGVSEDFVTQNLILELFSQQGRRLDQLGLQYDKVRQRVDQLQASDRSLSDEMAYQLAVMEQAEERFGALVDSAEGQKTGLERLTATWKDFQKAVGQVVSPLVNLIGGLLAKSLEVYIARLNLLYQALLKVAELLAQTPLAQAIADTGIFGSGAQPSGTTGAGGAASAPARFKDEATAAIVDWFRQTEEIERRANQDRIEATRQYEQQRSDTIRRYEQTIAREAQDFAISRARAEEDYAISLQRMRRDIAQREAKQLEDLERTIAAARGEAAERASARQAELQEHIAETRAQSQERIAELEEEFNTRRERAARDHAENLLEAAGRLDAAAVAREQRDFAKQQRDADEDFNKRLAKEQRNEEKRLAELEKANAKQVEAEEKALNKRIEQAQDAYQRQLDDARAADEQRLTDMSADFTLRQTREDADRALRLQRLKEDHDAQLAELDRQHGLRIEQIGRQEAEARVKLDEEFEKELAALGIRTQRYVDKLKEIETASIAAFDAWFIHANGKLLGATPGNPFIAPPGQFPSLTHPNGVAPIAPIASSTAVSRTVSVGTIAPSIVINGTVGLDSTQIDAAVRSGIVKALEEISN